MVVVDTSVWIDHLRNSDALLVKMLEANQVLLHPFVLGEIACGNLKDRKLWLSLLGNLQRAPTAQPQEILIFIELHKLMGLGIGYIDAHLLASVKLHGACQLWTHDKRLAACAKNMGIAFGAK